jgi:hypothetical protein
MAAAWCARITQGDCTARLSNDDRLANEASPDFLDANFLADGPHATSRGKDSVGTRDEDDTLVVGLAVPDEQPSLLEPSDERRRCPEV